MDKLSQKTLACSKDVTVLHISPIGSPLFFLVQSFQFLHASLTFRACVFHDR